MFVGFIRYTSYIIWPFINNPIIKQGISIDEYVGSNLLLEDRLARVFAGAKHAIFFF